MLEATPGRPSVVVRARGTGGGRTLLLCGHIDTVGVEGMTEPFAPRIDGDRLYGRGAYDMKAGAGGALLACREAAAARAGRRRGGRRRRRRGARQPRRAGGAARGRRRRRDRHRADRARRSPSRTRASSGSEIEVTGRAAHGSRPHLGVDAIVRPGPILTALGELDVALGARTHPLLGRGSVHASLIAGGEELSTYPARCVARAGAADAAGRDRRRRRGRARALLDRCRRGPARGSAHAAGARAVRDRPGRGDRRRCVRAAAAERAELAGASYWADAAFIAAAGIPTVMFGPGGEGAHAAEEWVSIADTEAWPARSSRSPTRVLRVSALHQPAVRPGRGARRRRGEARAFHAALDRLPPDAAARARRRRSGSRTSPTASGCPAFKVLGASWAIERALRGGPGRSHARRRQRGQPRSCRRARRSAARARCRVFLPGAAAAGTPRGDRGRGRRGGRGRRRLRGGGRAGGGDGARPGCFELADVGASGPADWVIDGYATLFAEVDEQAASTSLLVPVGVGSLAAAAARFGAQRRRRGGRRSSPTSRRA